MAEEAKEQVVMQPEPCIYVTNSHRLRLPGFEKGIVSPRDKVAIVGFAPSSMTDVRPYFDDPHFEIWGINQLYIAFPMMAKKATRWFQIHHRTEYDTALRDHKHHQWLAGVQDATPQSKPHDSSFPIYMQDPVPEDIPMAIPFPKDEVLAMFGRYFTNSISWEIALAIYETVEARKRGWPGFRQIYIFGVDMATGEEFAEQRPSCEFFIGWAKGLGIDVFVPPKSDLCKTLWLYPYEDEAPFKQKISGRRVELRNRMQGLAAQEQQIHDERLTILGALDNMNYIEQTWCLSRKELSIDKQQSGLPEPPPPEPPQEVIFEELEEVQHDNKQIDLDVEPAVVGGGHPKNP